MSYQVYRRVGEEDFEQYQTIDPGQKAFNDTDVVNGVEYHYYITATNKYGESDPSVIVNATPLGMPDPPIAGDIEEGDRYNKIDWAPPDDIGGTPLTEYNIYRFIPGSVPDLIETVDPDVFSYTDNDIDNGVTYRYFITAVNIVGESLRSEYLTGTPYTIPNPPKDPSFTTGSLFINLSWDPPDFDGGKGITEYRVYRGGYIIGTTQDLFYNDTDILYGQEYSYFIKCVNPRGESEPSITKTATVIEVPTPPLNLRVDAGDGRVDLEWEPPSNVRGSPVSYYHIYRSTNEDDLSFTYTVPAENLTYHDVDVENGVKYNYAVKAMNGAGYSLPSDVVSGTPLGLPLPPVDLEAEIFEYGITVYWGVPEEDGGAPIIGYRVFREDGISPREMMGSVDGSISDYSDEEVQLGMSYIYSVVAVTSVGPSEHSIGVRINYTWYPTAPLSLNYTVDGYRVILVWDEPESGGGLDIIEYRIYRSYYNSTWERIGKTSEREFSYLPDIPLVYRYRITAVNGMGEGPCSDEVEVIYRESNNSVDGNRTRTPWLFIIIGVILFFLFIVLASISAYVIINRRKAEEEENVEEPEETGFLQEGLM